jgi:hypothetical protein
MIFQHENALRWGPPERNTVRIVSFRADAYSAGWPSENALKLIQWVNARLLEIPPEFRDIAEVNFEAHAGWEGESELSVEVSFVRSETDEEFAARQTLYAEALAAKEAEEAIEFNRLKQKFEGGR